MFENEGHTSEGTLKFEIPDITEFQKQLPFLEQDLLLTSKRELASQTILSVVHKYSYKLPASTTNILQKLLYDETIERTIDKTTQTHAIETLLDGSHNQQFSIKAALSKICEKLCGASKILNYEPKLSPISVEHLNKLLESSDEQVKQYILLIFAKKPEYSVTNFEAIEKILAYNSSSNIQQFIYKILLDATNSGKKIPDFLTTELIYKAAKPSISNNIREGFLNIVALQIKNHDIANFENFKSLTNNLEDSNYKLVGQTLDIFSLLTSKKIFLASEIFDKINDEKILNNLLKDTGVSGKLLQCIGCFAEQQYKSANAIKYPFSSALIKKIENIVYSQQAGVIAYNNYAVFALKHLLSYSSFVLSSTTIKILIDVVNNPDCNAAIKRNSSWTIAYSIRNNKNVELYSYVIDSLNSAIASLDQEVRNAANTALSYYNKIDLEPAEEADSIPFKLISEMEEVTEEIIDNFLNKIAELNKDNNDIREKLINSELLKTTYLSILSAYGKDSTLTQNDKAIAEWTEENISNWSSNLLNSSGNKALQQDFLPEMLAVVKKANILYTGNDPRPTQILSILILLLSPEDKGMLTQIATGEGKSTISAMLAVIFALRGEKVDVITTSSVLAKRDVENRKAFFEMFNLTSDHNIDEQNTNTPKKCYKTNIVYGDVGSFQYDFLKTIYKGYNTRGDREFARVIIDEADSMLIDEGSKLARLASPVAGMEYLEPLLVAVWYELQQLDSKIIHLETEQKFIYINGNFDYTNGVLRLLDYENNQNLEEHIFVIDDLEDFRLEHLVCYLNLVIEQKLIHLPNYLKEFALKQINAWAESAIQAKLMEENKSYIIIKDKENKNVIVPVDYHSTGIVQERTAWNNGLHQFLQLKHGLKLTAENFTTSFISNLSYFKNYGTKIFGMTGTLGSEASQALLTSIYPISLAFIPTYKPKQFEEIEGLLVSGQEQWLNTVIERINEETSKGRGILIICETIHDAKRIGIILVNSGHSENKVRIYSRSDNDESLAIENIIDSGDIIVATNLAGRGTDIKTSKNVEDSGGLQVFVLFLPDNLRVEEQAYGRTARQGNKGNAQLIIEKESTFEKLGISNYEIGIYELKELRNLTEVHKIQKIKNEELSRIILYDNLFMEFCEFSKKLKAQQNSKYKLQQLEEHWGIKLKQIQQDLSNTKLNIEEQKEYAFGEFAEFKEEMQRRYLTGYDVISNPAYLIIEGLNKFGVNSRYSESIEILSQAIEHEEIYSFAAYYNRAYAKISENYAISMQKGEVSHKLHAEALQDLTYAKEQIEGVVIPHLEMMQMLSKHSIDSQFAMQIIGKINLLKLLLNHIDMAITATELCDESSVMNISNASKLSELIQDESYKDEIMELSLFGIHQIFMLETAEPANTKDAGILVAALGVGQFVVGAMCMAAMPNLGAALIIDGVSDLYKATKVVDGRPFSWKGYAVDKAITAAITVATMGAENVASKYFPGKAATGAKATGSTIAAKETVKQAVISEAEKKMLVQAAIKEAVIKAVVNIGIDHVADKLSEEAVRNFKEQISKHVSNAINNCFAENTVHSELNHILAVDSINHNQKYQDLVLKAVNDILLNKRSYLLDIVNGTLSALTKSQNSTLKVAAYATRGSEMAYDISKLQDFADSFASHLATEIGQIEKGLPTYSDFICSKMHMRLTKAGAYRVLELLGHAGFLDKQTGKFVSSRINGIDNMNFNELQHYHDELVTICKEVYTSLNQDYSSNINSLASSISLRASQHLTQMLQSKVVCPLMHEALYKPAQIISAKLIGASAELAQKIRNISENSTAAVAAGDEEEEEGFLSKLFRKIKPIETSATSINEEDFSVKKLPASFYMDGLAATDAPLIPSLKSTLILGDKALVKFEKFQEQVIEKDNQIREHLEKNYPKTYKGIKTVEGISNWIMEPDPVTKVVLGKIGEGFEWVEKNISEKAAKRILPKIGINEGDEGFRTGSGFINFATTSAIGGVAGKTLKVVGNAYKASQIESNILKTTTKMEAVGTAETATVSTIKPISKLEQSTSIAKEKVVSDPLITRKYIREMEKITSLGIEGEQLSHLRQALQQQEFKKLDTMSTFKHRNEFDKIKGNLRKEWETNTGKKWPRYTQEVGNKKVGDLYDAHHIIKVDHGGPHTWWNIHPANMSEHGKIHSKGSMAREIFDNK